MARYEHLPIFREAYDLTVHIEKIVRNFSRYHKYTLGKELRNRSRSMLEKIMEANNARDRLPRLLELRHGLESLKITARLCHESGGFASTRGYLYVAERITNIAKQNEGWIRNTQDNPRRRRRPRQRKTETKQKKTPGRNGPGRKSESEEAGSQLTLNL